MPDTPQTSPTSASADELFNTHSIISSFRHRTWTLVSVSLATFVTVVVFTLQATPKYTATSSVVLNVNRTQVVSFEEVLSGVNPTSDIVETEVEVLGSRSLAQAVAQRLNLVNVPEFNRRLRTPGFRAAVRSRIRSVLMPGSSVLGNDADVQQREFESVVNSLMRAVSMRREPRSFMITIAARSETPSLARDIANAYADTYLTSQLEAKFEATERADTWLRDRLSGLREEVRIREEAVANFKESTGLIDVRGTTIVEQQVASLNGQLAAERAELSAAQARLNAVRSQLERNVPADTIAEVLNSAVIRSLRDDQAQVARRQADLIGRYGERHPERLTVARELEDISFQIEAEIARIVANLENQVNVAAQRVRSLEVSLVEAREELAEDNAAIVRLRELEREAEAGRGLFQRFLDRSEQVTRSEGLASPDARVVARAFTPTGPSSPNVTLNLLLAVMAGCVAGGSLGLALGVLESGVYSESDVETHFGLAHIASVKTLSGSLRERLSGKVVEPIQYIVDKPLSSFSESFRTIRSAIRISSIDTKNTVIAVSSPLPGDGKTTIAVCLGRVSAMAGSSVLIIDGDLRRRRLTKMLCPDVDKGLLEVLDGTARLEDVVVRDEASGLLILPVAESTFTPRDIFSSESFGALMAQLRIQYDQVIMDTAPLLAVSDVRMTTPHIDSILMVVLWKKTPVGLICRALDGLSASKVKVLGVVLNKVNLRVQAYYGYRGYYGSGYYYGRSQKYYSD